MTGERAPARAEASPGLTRRPVWPSTTRSTMPPTRVTTGRPAAIASRITVGHASAHRGHHHRGAERNIATTRRAAAVPSSAPPTGTASPARSRPASTRGGGEGEQARRHRAGPALPYPGGGHRRTAAAHPARWRDLVDDQRVGNEVGNHPRVDAGPCSQWPGAAAALVTALLTAAAFGEAGRGDEPTRRWRKAVTTPLAGPNAPRHREDSASGTAPGSDAVVFHQPLGGADVAVVVHCHDHRHTGAWRRPQRTVDDPVVGVHHLDSAVGQLIG